MASYDVLLLAVGIAILGAATLPRLVSDKPMSFPLLYVLAGMVLFTLPLGVEVPDPIEYSQYTERLTELVVIIALMGAGLKLDRPFDVSSWSNTWRLLGIAMPLTIAATALLAWGVLGALAATALLLGAVVAPTDPVLASDVQATPPTEEVDEEVDTARQEGRVRFALTSEAGLNDGLAFPFTYLAIAVAAASGTDSLAWLGEWVLIDLGYRIVVGIAIGYVVGKLLSRLIFGVPVITDLARSMAGAEALAATLISYGVTELVHGYGFIAVFVTALVIRHHEWDHEYYQELHDFAVSVERLLMAAVLVLFGGAISSGLLAPLGWLEVLVAVAVVLVVRPLAGVAAFLGSDVPWDERLVVSFFGIRGIGSFFYLSFALNEASFAEMELLVAAEALWAFLGCVVLVSVFVHGISANWAMDALDRRKAIRRAHAHPDGEE